MDLRSVGGTLYCRECNQPMLYIYDIRARHTCDECGGKALWHRKETDKSTKIPPYPYGRYST